MKKPSDDQIARAEQTGPASMVARQLRVHKRSVVSARKLLRKYRFWEALSACEAELPFADRRVEFMSLSRRTINVLRRAGVETGAQLVSLSSLDLVKLRGVSDAVLADIRALLHQDEGDANDTRRAEKAPPRQQGG